MAQTESPSTRSGRSVPAQRRKLTPLIAVGLWLASVTVMTGLFSGVMWFLRASGTPTQATLDGWLWNSRDKKLTTLRDAYNGRQPLITDPHRDEIEQFLVEATKSKDPIGEGTWVGVLDEGRFRRRMLQTPWASSLSWLDRRRLNAQPIHDLSLVTPNQITHLKILQIVPWAGTDETLVFTLAQQAYHEHEPVLFWLCQVNGNWRIVDWEWIDSGQSESASAGHWAVLSGDPLFGSYLTAITKLREADQMQYSQRAEYERCLRDAAACQVPNSVADYMRYLIMHRWSSRYRPEEVRRLADLVLEPDRVPGVHVLRAMANQQLGKTEESLAGFDHIEKLIGFRPNLIESRAHLLQRLRRRDDALAEWRRLADFDPGEQSYLSELLRLLPKNKRSEVLDRIKAQPEPLKLAAAVARFNRYQADEAFLKELSQFAQSVAADSAEAREIEVVRLECSNQYLAAAALSRKAAEQQSDKPKQRQDWNQYLRQMHLAGELLAGFAAHPDPKAAFHDLVVGLDEGEAMIELAELPPLLAAYREKQPNDPLLLYYEGLFEADKRRFAEADQKYAAAERLLPPEKPKKPATGFGQSEDEDDANDEDDVDGLRYQLRYHRCLARYDMGHAVEALEEYGRDESVYQTLANLAAQYHHWAILGRLNQSFAIQQPQSLWLTYYEARILLAAKKFDAARGKLLVLNTRQKEVPGITYRIKELETDLLLAEVPDPIVAYQRSVDYEAAFNRLSHKLLAEREWDTLTKLCQQNRAGAKSHEVVSMQLEQAWRQQDHAGLVKLLTPWPTEALSQRPYVEPIWRERLVRSLLRLNRWEEAHQHAQESHRLHEEIWPLVMTDVARNNAGEIAKLLREDESFAESWKYREFATDPELKAVLQHPNFAAIRQQQEFVLPNYRTGESLVLLCRKPAALSESWLRQRLAPADVAVEIKVLAPTSFVVTWKNRRFQIVSFPTRYFSDEFVDRMVPLQTRLRPSQDPASIYLEQQTQLVIVPLKDDVNETWIGSSVSAREVATQLLCSDVVAAIHARAGESLKSMIPIDEHSADQLASRRLLSELNPKCIELRHLPNFFHLDPEKKRTLIKLLEARRTESNPPPFRVDVLMIDDQLKIWEPFRVTDIRRQRFGNYELIAEYSGKLPNLRFPELRPGVKFVVPIDQVYNFESVSP